jgi:hypothetical protein
MPDSANVRRHFETRARLGVQLLGNSQIRLPPVRQQNDLGALRVSMLGCAGPCLRLQLLLFIGSLVGLWPIMMEFAYLCE